LRGHQYSDPNEAFDDPTAAWTWRARCKLPDAGLLNMTFPKLAYLKELVLLQQDVVDAGSAYSNEHLIWKTIKELGTQYRKFVGRYHDYISDGQQRQFTF
jgi:hypothetical protein